eukprot:scaffold171536_cov99-Cyclotella_meneghiniana.AAC.2
MKEQGHSTANSNTTARPPPFPPPQTSTERRPQCGSLMTVVRCSVMMDDERLMCVCGGVTRHLRII